MATAITVAEAERLRAHHCGGKDQMTAAQARGRRTWMQSHGSPLEAYHCLFCDAWHVGHQPCMETVEIMARFIRFGVSLDAVTDESPIVVRA